MFRRFFKKKQESPRSESGRVLNSESWDLLQMFGPPTGSGAVVTKTTSLQVAAVYACVRLIAGAIGGIPLRVYTSDASGARSLVSTGQAAKLLSVAPSPSVTPIVFWESIVSDILLDGNGYAVIDRNRNGDPCRLVYVSPNRVSPRMMDGRLVYIVSSLSEAEKLPSRPSNGPELVAFEADEMLHFPGLGWDGVRGRSIIGSVATETIANSLSANKFSAKFFSQGLQAPGYLKFPEKLTREQFELIREHWRKNAAGVDNAHLPPIITEGGEFRQLTIKADEVQLLETRKFQVEDIARIFGVPPFMIGSVSTSTSWGTGIEQQSMGFVRHTLRPNMTRIEQEVGRKLFRSGRSFVEFDASRLLRGDVKSRNESYQVALGGNQQPGWKSVNEIRKEENLPPIAGGDEIYRPQTGAPNEPETGVET